MASKRPNSAIHPSRQEQVPREFSNKRRKVLPPTHTSGTGKSFKKAHPINDLKSKVRSLTRLLQHAEDMPPHVKIEKERALQSAQFDLEEETRAKKRSDMIGKYHKIRFFDRQKATKRLKRAKKELKEAEEKNGKPSKELKKKVDDCEVDVNYAQFYPLDVAYVSLFPSRRNEKDSADQVATNAEVERQGDPEMWQKVKQAMADGRLDALRNGVTAQPKEEEAAPTASKKGKKDSKSDKANKASGKTGDEPSQAQETDDESDGGFFE